MGEPARKLPIAWDDGTDDDESEGPLLQRWIEHPDGRVEFVERPLTPEDFLNAQLEDKVSQGKPHARFRRRIASLLERHFGSAAQVLEDVLHEFGPGLPTPSPDVSVVPGDGAGYEDEDSFSVTNEGVRPALILEIVSPSRRSIREVDEVDKVELYSRAGIPDYLLLDLPRRGNGYRLGLKGYRLGADGRYRPLEPDAQGHLLCKATRLRFFISPGGDRIEVIDDVTGLPLLYSEDEEAGRKAEKAARQAAEAALKAAESDREAEKTARKSVEAENAQLREELERLRSQTRREP